MSATIISLTRTSERKLMKRTLALLILLSWLPLSLSASQGQASQPKPLAFTNVNVIDATGAALKTGMTVLIIKGRIAALGKFGKTRIPSNT